MAGAPPASELCAITWPLHAAASCAWLTSSANTFNDAHIATVGCDFHLLQIEHKGQPITLHLWDLAGQDRFGVLYRAFYSGALAAIVMADLKRPSTLENAAKWKAELDSKTIQPDGSGAIPALLLVNKLDLVPDFDADAVADFARSHGFAGWLACSAKDGTNVAEAMAAIGKIILKNPAAIAAQQSAKAARDADADVIALQGGGDRSQAGASSGCC